MGSPDVAHDDRHNDQRHYIDASRAEDERCDENSRERQAQHHGHQGADPHRNTRYFRQPGQVRERDPTRGADEHTRENRAAPEAAQRNPVSEALKASSNMRAPTE